MKKKVNHFLKVILATVAVIAVAFGLTSKAEAQELSQTVSKVELRTMEDTLVPADANGIYQLATKQSYKFRFEFDLSNYDGVLQNGDTFSFTIPAPIDVLEETVQLDDNDTGVNVAEAVIVSNGVGQGANVTVTLKNLEEYLRVTGKDLVIGVSGDLAVKFKFNEDLTKHTVVFDSAGMKAPVTHVYSTKTNTNDFTGYENFAINGGLVTKGVWGSDKLRGIGVKSTGKYYSPWRLRLNTGAQDLGANVVVHDEVALGNIQYIPESFKVYSTAMLDGRTTGVASLKDAKLLTEGVDYALHWNASYTAFDLVLFDGSKQYYVDYNTTTPNDDTLIANSLSMTKADGTVLTQRSDNNRTVHTQTVTSLYTGTVDFNTKSLTQVISDVRLLNGDDTTQQTDAQGIYQIGASYTYKLRFEFDLSKYDGNLQNGDKFTFTISEPMDIKDAVSALEDLDTGVNIGEAVIVSNGEDKGATVTVTLQNLENYLEKTGGTSVVGVAGNFGVYFKIDEEVTARKVIFNSNVMKQPVNHLYTTKLHLGKIEGYENYAINGGQAQKADWSSAALKAINKTNSGKFYSQWLMRINTGAQDLGANVVVRSDVSENNLNYIPESIKVYSTAQLTTRTAGRGVLKDAKLLTQGVDYTIKWNKDYSSFDIVLADGSKQYFIEARTTTPNDDTFITNTLSVTKADGTVLTQRSNNNRKSMTKKVTSLYSGLLTGYYK